MREVREAPEIKLSEVGVSPESKLGDGGVLTPERKRMIDEATRDAPELRLAMHEAFEAFCQPDVLGNWLKCGPAEQAHGLIALRDACRGLVEKKPCDFCARVATRVRSVFIPSDGDFGPSKRPKATSALTVQLILCDDCAKLDPAVRKNKMLEGIAREQQETGEIESSRTAIVGQSVGEATRLAQRSALQPCHKCGQPVWFDHDTLDRYGQTVADVAFVCRQCADQLHAAGKLEQLPIRIVGPVLKDSA
jgi:hypothetical protein